MMLTLLAVNPLHEHALWLRLGDEMLKTGANPPFQLGDYLNISTNDLSGIILRQHFQPWRIDVLCHRPKGDALTSQLKALCLEQGLVNVTRKTWPEPHSTNPLLLLAHDDNGLAALGMLYHWRHVVSNAMLLWHTQGHLPLPLCPSMIYTPQLPDDMIATMALCESLGIVLRILSDIEKPGCFHGDITALLKQSPDLSTWELVRYNDN